MNQERLIFLEPFESLDDFVVAFPVARRAADTAVDDQVLRVFCDLVVEIVHEHSDGGLSSPVLGSELASPPGAYVAAVVASLLVRHVGSL